MQRRWAEKSAYLFCAEYRLVPTDAQCQAGYAKCQLYNVYLVVTMYL